MVTSLTAVSRTASGSYTGNGNSGPGQAITGVGFSPRYVRVWERETSDGGTSFINETTPEIIDDNVAGGGIRILATALTFQDDTFETLDSDGFTVGDDGTSESANASGVDYNFLAIK